MNWEIFRPSKSTITCLILLVFAFLLMVFRLTSTVQMVRYFLFYWVSPSYQVLSMNIEATSVLSKRLATLINASRENEVLREKMFNVTLMDALQKETFEENRRLRDILNLKERIPFETIPAKISAVDPQNWTSAFWIDQGTNNGIKLNSPVLAIKGAPDENNPIQYAVIGRIWECIPDTCKVLLLSDPLSSIAAYLPRNEEQGLVQGKGHYEIGVLYLNQSGDFKAGDEVLTSGLGGIFPKGLPIGTLENVRVSPSRFVQASVRPYISLSRLNEVLVIDGVRP